MMNLFCLLIYIYRGHLSLPVYKICLFANLIFIGEIIIIYTNKTFEVPLFGKNTHYLIVNNEFFLLLINITSMVVLCLSIFKVFSCELCGP